MNGEGGFCVGQSPNPTSEICINEVATFYIETPATVGVPWVDIKPEDSGKFLSNDGASPYWQEVAYSEENFSTGYKESLDALIDGDFNWKESSW